MVAKPLGGVYGLIDFMRQYPTNNISRFAAAPVTKWMLIILGVSFLVDIVGMGDSFGRLKPHFAIGNGVLHEIWRWVTYPLIDFNIGSWLFSMITFFVFGKLAEPAIGSRRFSMLLIYTTLIGAVVYSVMSSTSLTPLTGATGLSMAVLVAVAMMYPDQTVQLLIPPVPMKLKTLVIGLIGFLVVMAIVQRADPAETLAHLSGVGVSFLCMKNLKWLDLGGKKKSKQSAKRKKAAQKSVKRGSGMKPRTILNMSVSKREAEVDRILEKVSAEGIGNLTDEEKEMLKFASKND